MAADIEPLIPVGMLCRPFICVICAIFGYTPRLENRRKDVRFGSILSYDNQLLKASLKLAHIKPRSLHRFGVVRDRSPQLGSSTVYARQIIRDKLLEHKHYIAEHGEDL